MDFETWDAGGGFLYVFTNNPEQKRKLKNILKRCATYERNGKPFAWQFRIERSKLKFIEREISKNETVENKQVADSGIGKNRIRDTKSARPDEDIIPVNEANNSVL